ncbi:MAG: TetR/AcrR family transcriptional regulator [Streptosporangiaceae bacterium]
MGRPSMAAERHEQILDAVTRCVGLYGLDGTTLERVAEASGFSRGHVRHYVGNRDEMLRAFRERLTFKYVQSTEQMCAAAEPGQRGSTIVQFLFGQEWAPGVDNAAIDALMWAAARDEDVRDQLRVSYLSIERTLTNALRDDYPEAPAAECASTAYALLCLAFAHSTLLELSVPAARHRSVVSAGTALLERLGSFVSAAG